MRTVKVASLLLVFIVSANVFGANKVSLSEAKIVVLSPKKTICNKAAQMLRDEIEKRTRIGLDVVSEMPRKDKPAIVVATAKELSKNLCALPAGLDAPQKPDGYALWVDKKRRKAVTVCLAGHDDRGALYAAGRLLRVLDMSRDRVAIDGDTRLATAPKYSLRGHQFGYRPKTNSYDAWTIEMWEQYYREMVVFGMNALELIPPRSDDADDSPHFPTPQMETTGGGLRSRRLDLVPGHRRRL
jgi:hypothetical protein